jgi:hypothetical protein
MKNHSAPVTAAILLLLLLLYVASYLVLVMPPNQPNRLLSKSDYRFGGRVSTRLYWPLEQIDRKMRPALWDPLATRPL